MILRVARHTQDLKQVEAFYVDILGLEKIGGLEGHDGYDGVFIGWKDTDWHLEFTTSADLPVHTFDEDDLLVLYPQTQADYDGLIQRLDAHGIARLAPKNPYALYCECSGYDRECAGQSRGHAIQPASLLVNLFCIYAKNYFQQKIQLHSAMNFC